MGIINEWNFHHLAELILCKLRPSLWKTSKMSQPKTVAAVVGSMRKDSVSRKLAKTFAELVPSLDFRFPEIGDLPMFNQDLEAAPPAEWVRFRKEIAAVDAVLFVTPEYNRSLPGVLKNAIDVASRPYGSSVWNGKPGAVIKYRNAIPLQIVDVFERHGFIWGGRWNHFDTMHFEYRPELLPAP